MVNARLLDRNGAFIDAIALNCIAVIVLVNGRHFVAIGDAWKRPDGTIDQDYAEQGVYCVSKPLKQ